MKKCFSEEDKIRMVDEVKSGIPLLEVCEKEGVGRSTLYRWMELYAPRKRWNAQKSIDLNAVKKMERRLAVLEEENLIFKKSGCGTKSSIEEKIAAIDSLQGEFTIYALCRTLNVLRSTYYHRKLRAPEKTWFDAKNEVLRPAIKAYFKESKERFGASKITVKLRQAGFVVGQKHVAKLMKEMGLVCKQSQLRAFNSTNRKYKYRRNRLQQNFHQDAPNKTWVSDVTYARVNEDIYSICIIIDLFARKVLSYVISASNNMDLVMTTFQKAYELRYPPEGLMFHSDQGQAYTAYKFRKHLRDLKVIQSFSNPGTPYDNAVAESFFSIMKREELSHNWYHTLEELDNTVADFIQFFNSYRPLRKLGNLTPDQYESRYWSEHK